MLFWVPIQNRKQYDIVADLVRSAESKGRVLLGGDPGEIRGEMGGKGYFYPLTIIADLENGDPLVDEEQFGPFCRLSAITRLRKQSRRQTIIRTVSGGRSGAET